MGALTEIRRALERSTPRLRNPTSLAQEIHDALDVAGYLIEPDGPLVIQLDSRAVTHETELTDGIELLWNSDTVVGIRIRDGFDLLEAS